MRRSKRLYPLGRRVTRFVAETASIIIGFQDGSSLAIDANVLTNKNTSEFDFPGREGAVLDFMARTVAPIVGKRLVEEKVGSRGVTLAFDDGSTLDIYADVFTNLNGATYSGLTYGYVGPEFEQFATTGWLFHDEGSGVKPPRSIVKR